jgi:hypothetical protein
MVGDALARGCSKLLEDALGRSGGDTRTLVGDQDAHAITSSGYYDVDAAADWSVLDGIAEQVL